jgi:hypothetical protein
MRANMRTIESTGMESTPGTMESNTKAGGKMESNMEKEPTAKMVAID